MSMTPRDRAIEDSRAGLLSALRKAMPYYENRAEEILNAIDAYADARLAAVHEAEGKTQQTSGGYTANPGPTEPVANSKAASAPVPTTPARGPEEAGISYNATKADCEHWHMKPTPADDGVGCPNCGRTWMIPEFIAWMQGVRQRYFRLNADFKNACNVGMQLDTRVCQLQKELADRVHAAPESGGVTVSTPTRRGTGLPSDWWTTDLDDEPCSGCGCRPSKSMGHGAYTCQQCYEGTASPTPASSSPSGDRWGLWNLDTNDWAFGGSEGWYATEDAATRAGGAFAKFNECRYEARLRQVPASSSPERPEREARCSRCGRSGHDHDPAHNAPCGSA